MEMALARQTESMTAVEPLNDQEQAGLAACEAAIGQGLTSFIEVGRALMTIRDGRLYRGSHKTFEDYCRDRWQMGRAHAGRCIDASRVAGIVSPIKVVDQVVAPVLWRRNRQRPAATPLVGASAPRGIRDQHEDLASADAAAPAHTSEGSVPPPVAPKRNLTDEQFAELHRHVRKLERLMRQPLPAEVHSVIEQVCIIVLDQ